MVIKDQFGLWWKADQKKKPHFHTDSAVQALNSLCSRSLLELVSTIAVTKGEERWVIW